MHKNKHHLCSTKVTSREIVCHCTAVISSSVQTNFRCLRFVRYDFTLVYVSKVLRFRVKMKRACNAISSSLECNPFGSWSHWACNANLSGVSRPANLTRLRNCLKAWRSLDYRLQVLEIALQLSEFHPPALRWWAERWEKTVSRLLSNPLLEKDLTQVPTALSKWLITSLLRRVVVSKLQRYLSNPTAWIAASDFADITWISLSRAEKSVWFTNSLFKRNRLSSCRWYQETVKQALLVAISLNFFRMIFMKQHLFPLSIGYSNFR